MSVRMWPAAKDLPVFAQMAVRLLDALDERLPARSRPSNTGSFRKIPFRRNARSASTHTSPSRRGQMSKSPVAFHPHIQICEIADC